ncbi:MAG: hypothetical protein VX640_12855 [Pseudomonadota bacterium]|nr:hypothetical protein [Pseudomonadota bacterium]
MTFEARKRKDAMKALFNILLLEGALLFAVVSVYLYTDRLTNLVGGLTASSLIFAPTLLRWTRDHAPALKASTVGPARK